MTKEKPDLMTRLLCGGFDNYRSLSHYLREVSEFIHWYEQMFDHKPWERKCL